MNDLIDKLNNIAEFFIEQDEVTYADVCYEAATALQVAVDSTSPKKASSKVLDEQSGDLIDELALALSKVLNKFVPEDEQNDYIEPLLKYEEYVND